MWRVYVNSYQYWNQKVLKLEQNCNYMLSNNVRQQTLWKSLKYLHHYINAHIPQNMKPVDVVLRVSAGCLVAGISIGQCWPPKDNVIIEHQQAA